MLYVFHFLGMSYANNLNPHCTVYIHTVFPCLHIWNIFIFPSTTVMNNFMSWKHMLTLHHLYWLENCSALHPYFSVYMATWNLHNLTPIYLNIYKRLVPAGISDHKDCFLQLWCQKLIWSWCVSTHGKKKIHASTILFLFVRSYNNSVLLTNFSKQTYQFTKKNPDDFNM